MTMLTLYSLIAVCTLSIALAAQTKSLWRVGCLFAANWATLVLISSEVIPSSFATPSVLAAVYVANTLLNFRFYLQHRCSTGLAIASLQIVSVMLGGYSHDTLNSVSINFVLSALIIIGVSLSHVLPVEIKNHKSRAQAKTEKKEAHLNVGS